MGPATQLAVAAVAPGRRVLRPTTASAQALGALIETGPVLVLRAALVRDETVTMVVQVNGKVRAKVEVSPDMAEAEAVALALALPKVIEALAGAEPTRVVARPPRLVNIVV